MTVLLLRLAAPMQSWGTSSRFSRRNTDRTPSKSGIVGLLAAAEGRRRTDPLEGLLDLRVGVRTEQAGTIERDFQTAAEEGERTPISLSYRFYLADAVFLAAVEGRRPVLEGLREALRRPAFPLFLGRRSCPPVGRLDQGLRDHDIETVLEREPWHASEPVMRALGKRTVALDGVADCSSDNPKAYLVRDEPLTFDPRHRQWEWRAVKPFPAPVVPNPLYVDSHDPMAVL